MWLMKVMRQGSELHGLAIYINKYNWLCVFRWGDRKAKKTRLGGRVDGIIVYFFDVSLQTQLECFHTCVYRYCFFL